MGTREGRGEGRVRIGEKGMKVDMRGWMGMRENITSLCGGHLDTSSITSPLQTTCSAM